MNGSSCSDSRASTFVLRKKEEENDGGEANVFEHIGTDCKYFQG